MRNVMVEVLGDNLLMTTVESSILEIKLPLVLKWTYYKENKIWKLEWNLSFQLKYKSHENEVRLDKYLPEGGCLCSATDRTNALTLRRSPVELDQHTDQERSSDLSAVIHPKALKLWATNLPVLRRERSKSMRFCSITFRAPILFSGSVWFSCL